MVHNERLALKTSYDFIRLIVSDGDRAMNMGSGREVFKSLCGPPSWRLHRGRRVNYPASVCGVIRKEGVESMSVQETIERKLGAGVRGLLHLEVINESDRHNVPPDSETHFKVVLVAEAFEGVGLLARHRMVNQLLADELSGGVHALAIHAYTRDEWTAKTGRAPQSPPCLGGGAAGPG
jgi:BolA protein